MDPTTGSNNSVLQQPDRQQVSPVNRMFDGRSVFVTGASGFIGRVLLEKLLRTYRGIDKIYILMRPKRNVPVKERLHRHLLDLPIFDQIKSLKDGQQLLEKIVVIPGDIGEPNLGISERDLDSLLADESLSIVFHSAATVKFDEPLKVAIKYNLNATRIVLELCRKMKNLISLCHVSTAYVNSHLKDSVLIEEKLYPMQQTPQDVLKFAEILDARAMQAMRSHLVGHRPNTYTYTKALAEHLIATEAPDLPVAIVRPSVVLAAWREPMLGWKDNLNGPTGLFLAYGKGALRSMHVLRTCKANVVPVDIVVNTMIASSFYAAKINNKLPRADRSTEQLAQRDDDELFENQRRQQEGDLADRKANEQQLAIFHCESGERNPITWAVIEDKMLPIARKYPSEHILRYPSLSLKSNRHHDFLARLFVHYLPALLIDLLCMVAGTKAQMLSTYRRTHRMIDSVSHFALIDYNFKSSNLELLESNLSESDKKELYLDIRPLDWVDFFEKYFLGIRRYILKEPDGSLDSARKSLRRAYYAEIGLHFLLLTLALLCGLALLSLSGFTFS